MAADSPKQKTRVSRPNITPAENGFNMNWTEMVPSTAVKKSVYSDWPSQTDRSKIFKIDEWGKMQEEFIALCKEAGFSMEADKETKSK